MKRLAAWPGCCLLALLLCQVAPVIADPVADLQAAGHLQLSSSLKPATGIVPGQKVTLTLEIATDRWFTGGTRIGIPEVPGLVILQTEQFASNASENRNGHTWVVQRWTLDVFPQRAGDFTIPPMPLQLQVNAGATGDIKGELYSPPSQFSAAVPASLAQAEHWVAAPEFGLRQNFDRALDGLQVGDALEQEIVFEASDVMAMMLPTYELERQPGLAAYPSPAVLDNSNNRGRSRASRRIRISYVVEAQGQYLLPARDYFWWNTAQAELQLLSLPETRITVGVVSTATGSDNATIPDISRRQWLALMVGLVLLAVVLQLARIFVPRLPLAKTTAALSRFWLQLQALRKPALPERLNPGGNAGD